MKNICRKYKVFIFLSAVVIIITLIDRALGIGMDFYLNRHSLPGDYQKFDYLMNKTKDDMIIIGSSIAINAYVPPIIEDSLGISCFNGGCNSQYFPFFQCMIENILNRYKPRYIVLALRREDFISDNMGRIDLLNPLYHRGNQSIDQLLEMKNGEKNRLLVSNLYRYNTIIWRIMLYHLKSFKEMGQKGFIPHETPKYPPVLDDQSFHANSNREWDPMQKARFLRIIAMCKQAGVQVIVTLPPVYAKLPDNGNPCELTILENLCQKHNLPLLNDCQSSFFLSRPDLFYDNKHLNGKGSEIYTQQFIEEWRTIFSFPCAVAHGYKRRSATHFKETK